MSNQRTATAIIVAIALLAISPAAMAISDEEFFRQIRFNFINPGARSMGFGGAFIAVADDATAAQANPAGLMQLAAPEFFVEVRHAFAEETTGRENIEMEPEEFVDFISVNERRAVTSPSFISYVKPYQKFAIGFSRQEVLNTRISSQTIFGAVEGFFAFTGSGEANLQVTHWNVAAAWRPVRWLSLGATASLGMMHIDSAVNNTIFEPSGHWLCDTLIDCDLDDDGENDPPELVPALQRQYTWFNTGIDDDDTAFTYSLGLLFNPSDKYGIGLVYRADTEYEFREERIDGVSSIVEPAIPNPDAVFDQTLHLPASYGLGFKWRPNSHWTIAADGVRINYSDLADGLVSNLNLLAAILGQGELEFAVDHAIDDVTEVHLGAEYLFSDGKVPWALRLGARTDPDNIMYDRNGAFGDALAGRDDEMHFSLGAGFVLQQKLQLDFAVSVSTLGTETVISSIYRF